MVGVFEKCCISDEMAGNMRKKLEMLAMNMRQDKNCEDTKLRQVIGMMNLRLVKLNQG
jgi:hypothetical protein